jgi:hypothetical protein
MAKKAKRLVSESRTQLIDCRRLLHIVFFRRALVTTVSFIGSALRTVGCESGSRDIVAGV